MKNAVSGQSLVELVLIIPVFVLIISVIFFFARALITKQQLLTAARYGTDLILYTKLNEKQIQQEVRNYLSDKNIEGRTLNANKLGDESIAVRIEGFMLPEFSGPYDLLNTGKLKELLNAGDMLLFPEKHTSWIEINYEFQTPRVISVLTKVIPGKPFPDHLTVSGRSEVLAGTGCSSVIHKRNR